MRRNKWMKILFAAILFVSFWSARSLLANRFKEVDTKGQIIGIFHSDAAYMTLNDKAYNVYRNVGTGNPYKELIAELIKQGVRIEECAVSMKNHK